MVMGIQQCDIIIIIIFYYYYYYYYYKCKDYSDAIARTLQGHFTIVRAYRVTVRLNNKQYDGSGDRPQTSDGQVSSDMLFNTFCPQN